MALAVDGSSPAVARSTGATTSTASFTPPANCALIAFYHADADISTSDEAGTVSGGGLSWTMAIRHNGLPGAVVEVWWATSVSSPGSITVDATDNKGAVAKSLNVKVFTGADLTNPIGATESGATATLTYTSTRDNSWGWEIGLGSGAPSAATGCTLDDSLNGTFDGGDSIWTSKQNSTTATSGTSVTTGASGVTAMHAVAVEILPAASASTLAGPPALVVPQKPASSPVQPLVVAPTIGPPQVIRLPQIVVVRHVKQPPAPFPLAVNPPFLSPQVIRPAPIMVAPQARLPQPPTISVSAAQIPSTALLPLTVTVVAEQFRPAVVAPIVLTPPFLAPPAQPANVLVAPQQFRPPLAPPMVVVPALLPSGQPVPTAPFWINPSHSQPSLPAITSITPPALPQAPAPISINPARSQPPLAAVIALTPPPLPQPPAPITVIVGRSQPQLATVITLVPPPLPQAAAPIVVVTSTWRAQPARISLSQPNFPVAALAAPPSVMVATFRPRPGVRPMVVTPTQLAAAVLTPDMDVSLAVPRSGWADDPPRPAWVGSRPRSAWADDEPQRAWTIGAP